MTEQEGVLLRALDGSNPLAFLAALGAFRLLTLESPDSKVQMCWKRADGAWRPRLRGVGLDEEDLCRRLLKCPHWAPDKEFSNTFGKNITVPKSTFKPFVDKACDDAKRQNRKSADFAAAFGCEIYEEEKKKGEKRIEYTRFCFLNGSSNQDLFRAISNLADTVLFEHLYDALFGEWRLEKAKGMSMRWDPADAVEYALQWNEPSGEGAWAVLGANRLAFEALPLFPTAPVGTGLQTTGFAKRNGQDEFTWPIWKDSLEISSIRSLLSLADLQEKQTKRAILCDMGVSEVYRAQIVFIGPKRKVSFRPARAL